MRTRGECVICGWEDPTWEWWAVQRQGTGFALAGWTPTSAGEALCSRGCVEKWVERWAAPGGQQVAG
jgi:hypothetical protein